MFGDSSGLSTVGSGAAGPFSSNNGTPGIDDGATVTFVIDNGAAGRLIIDDGAAGLLMIDDGASGLFVPEGKLISTFSTIYDVAGLFGTDDLIVDPA